MNPLIRSATRLCVIPLLAVATFGVFGPSARAQPGPSVHTTKKSLADLLKETALPFTEVQKGVFRVAVEVRGETAMITVEEKALNWKSNDGSPNLIAAIYTQVTPLFANDVRVPPAMLMRMAVLNDTLLFGGFSINGDQKKGVFYNSAFHLRTADSELLVEYLVLAHRAHQIGKKELAPFLQETSGN